MKCWYSGKCNLENKQCQENCLRFNNMNILVNNSGLPLDLQYPKILEPDILDRTAFNALTLVKTNIERFVDEGKCLYIWSRKTGNGKTTWSSKLLMSYFDRIWCYSQLKARGIYIYTPTFLNTLKTQFLNDINLVEYITTIKQTQLVIFDDLGVGKLSDFDRNNLLDIIDYRLNNHKSTIFTSNQDRTGLIELFGDRLASRIYNSSMVIEFKGRDRRGEN